jgi:hypothetical protein
LVGVWLEFRNKLAYLIVGLQVLARMCAVTIKGVQYSSLIAARQIVRAFGHVSSHH